MKYLLFLYIVEIILGGGGTIFSYRNISLRHINFILLLFISLFYLKNRLKTKVYLIMFAFIFLIILSSFMGLLNDSSIRLVNIDIKTFVGVLIILPISIFFNKKNPENIMKILENSIFVLGLGYFVLNLIFILSPFQNYTKLYNLFSSIGKNEILISGNRIFYKSIIFLNIGLIISTLKKQNLKVVFYLFLIFLSQTRGFYLGLILVFIMKIFIIDNLKYVKLLKVQAFILLSLFLVFLRYEKLINIISKPDSDLDRIIQIKQVFQSISLSSFIIGHGFGVGVPIRPVHFEISYLEIFHKQGILGLAFWIVILFYQTKIIKRNILNKEYIDMLGLYLGSCFIYAQSFTNPYITNPIGITWIILSSVFLIYKDKK